MVYINSKNIIPCYLPPLEDELFTSWLTRLAINHNLKPYTFAKSYFSDYLRIFNRDNDIFLINSLNEEFINHTILERDTFYKLFLTSYEGIVIEKAKQFTNEPYFLPLGILNKKRKNKGTLYCPSCLKNPIPYYKKQWRLVFSIACVECLELLKDSCDNCDSPIEYHNLKIFNTTGGKNSPFMSKNIKLKYCAVCGHDLSLNNSCVKPTAIEIEYQMYINQTIKNGYNEFANYSFHFFEVLKTLSHKLLSASNKNRFRWSLEYMYKQPIPTYKDTEFNRVSLFDRKLALIVIYQFLKTADLEEFFRRSKIPKTTFSNYRELPYWFIKNF